MLDVDDPDHARLRGLVHTVFTPKMVENMRQRVEVLTEKLLDAVQPRGLPGPSARVCFATAHFNHRANVGSTTG